MAKKFCLRSCCKSAFATIPLFTFFILFNTNLLAANMSNNSSANNSSTSKSGNTHYQKAILAGGCFWGVQELFRKQDGIIKTKVGYAGDNIVNPTYELVSTGLTKYAESIEITFDPAKISYEKILKFFFTIHNPTTIDRQENDVGKQYRSEIFYLNDEQKKIAQSVIIQANNSGVFKKPVVTKISQAGEFSEAEEHHQNYLQKNPYGYTCHHVRNEWKF